MAKFQKLVFSRVYRFTNGGKLNSNGKALIQIKCYQGGKCKFISTGIEVAPEHWNAKNKKVSHKEPLYDVFNAHIAKLESDLEKFSEEICRKFGKSTLEHLPLFNQETGQSLSFNAFCEKELERPEIRPTTRRRQRSTLKKLNEFNPQIKFEDLTRNFVKEFERFLIRQKLHVNSIQTQMKCIKAYINMAISSEKFGIEKNPFKDYKLKTVEPNRVYLTIEELSRIENLVIPEKMPHLVQIKKMFLFSAYTGFRHSDLCRISEKNLSETVNGLELIIRTQKNEKPMLCPLWSLFRYGDKTEWSEPEKILRDARTARKADHLDIIPVNEPFFRLSLQYYNRGLKTLAKLANINKNLTSHVARHTFGSIMAALIPIPMVQRLLTHSKSSQTDIYIHMNNHVLVNHLERIDWNDNRNQYNHGQRKKDRV